MGRPMIWEKIGVSNLHLSPIDEEENEIMNIETNFPNLRRISIFGKPDLNEKISRLLASFRDQLEYFRVEDMTESELIIITSACKNARFSASVNTYGGLYPTSKVLGCKLDKICFGTFPEEVDLHGYDDVRNAWNACVNIRDLKVRFCSIELVRTIMEVPKKNLKRIYIGPFLLSENELKALMGIFAEGTGGVEKLSFYGSSFSGDILDKLISRNQSSLSDVPSVLWWDFIGETVNIAS